jgi:hypothetical protein
LSDTIGNLQKAGIKVLTRRQLDSYLWDDEVLTKLCHVRTRPDLVGDLLAAKERSLAASVTRSNPKDDLKSASGELYNETREILGLTQCGSNRTEFAVSTLAPLVTEETTTYRELREDIFS